MAEQDDPHPAVSYVMPVLNEAGYIETAIRSVLDQDYVGDKELVVALGPSNDGTTEVVTALAAADPRIRTVPNPDADIPAGLNRAIRASANPIVVRVDAHSELEPGYTAAAVATLRRTGAANVGGVMFARGKTAFQKAVARAYNSPFGLGGARYHGGAKEGAAESAYLGVFRREALERAGLFDETIRRGEDWELNLRIRWGGDTVWFDPELKVTYWPRENWPKLARQFFATGVWRAELVRRYGGRNPWRFFAPPLLVLSLAASVVIGILQLTGVLHGRLGLVASAVYLAPILYLLLVLWVALTQDAVKPWRDRWLFLVVLPTMHVSWGAGFIVGLIRGARGINDTSRTEI
ncbi:glycosyltransferase family 2 protein [Leifsonia bigeumensis]|uniref:Glycosyltransferase family 2 protein n=1 Tax=Leifsonella bigeumensis TaxID=433643 RepID=A0ABP7FVL7_9MICO